MTTSAARLPFKRMDLIDAPIQRRHLPQLPVAALLESQARLTAVEQFARAHDATRLTAPSRLYRDIVPLARPKQHEQYAFEVDLDACTGCKSCVAACHTLNGLDEGESWRTVGLLHGGDLGAPALQTVTSSCHHCLEPACLQGCPVRAYEKDPITGIVKHLDDQCIGCQYCTLMCPYDAPKYNKSLGIVRKCDMCSDRLAHDEAPACAQACPNQAIAIRLVEREAVVEAASAGTFLPGAPAAEHTLPSTVYKTKRPFPRNLLPADYYRTRLEHAHPALVIMLTFTQLAVGAFALTYVAEHWLGREPGSPLLQSVAATSLALLALGASIFHLGRPQHAWRVFLGLRTSWLSREAVGFGIFAMLATLYGSLEFAGLLPVIGHNVLIANAAHVVRLAAATAGVLSVLCSVMVYVATRRAHWSPTQTGIRFFGTMLILGSALVLAVYLFTGGGIDSIGTTLLELILFSTLAKSALELATLAHYGTRQFSAMKRVAVLMLGDLAAVTRARLGLALGGGVALPVLLLHGIFAAYLRAAGLFLFVILVVSELLERYLFFRTAPASRMPGGLR